MQEIKPQEALPDLTQKVVLVYFVSGAPNNCAAIEKDKFELQGGDLFLVGRSPSSKLGWGPGILDGVAWSKVQSYYVFDSAEAFNTAYYGKDKPK